MTTLTFITILTICLMGASLLVTGFGLFRYLTRLESNLLISGIIAFVCASVILIILANIKEASPVTTMTQTEKIQMIKDNDIPVYLDGEEVENIDFFNPSEYNISFNGDNTIAYLSKKNNSSTRSHFFFIPFFWD